MPSTRRCQQHTDCACRRSQGSYRPQLSFFRQLSRLAYCLIAHLNSAIGGRHGVARILLVLSLLRKAGRMPSFNLHFSLRHDTVAVHHASPLLRKFSSEEHETWRQSSDLLFLVQRGITTPPIFLFLPSPSLYNSVVGSTYRKNIVPDARSEPMTPSPRYIGDSANFHAWTTPR